MKQRGTNKIRSSASWAGLWTVVILLLAVACSGDNDQASVVKNLSNALIGKRAPQSAATAITETPTPDAVIKLAFMGAQLIYNTQLYGPGADVGHAVALPPSIPSSVGYPENIHFFLGEATTADATGFSYRFPQIRIFPSHQFSEMSPAAASNINQLRQLLRERPHDVEPPLPLLPHLPELQQIFHTRPSYIEFDGGRGLRYLTQYERDQGLISGRDMFYTFQGLSDDEAYYIAAFLPLTAVSLTGHAENGESAALENGEAWDAYRDTLAMELSEMSPDAFTPNLNALDELIASLQLAPSDEFPATNSPHYTVQAGIMLGHPASIIPKIEKVPAQLHNADGTAAILTGVPDFIHVTLSKTQAERDKQASTLLIQPIRDVNDAYFASIPAWQREHFADLERQLANQVADAETPVVQSKHIAFQNGSGIRVITQVTQELKPEALTNQNLAYLFEGFTENGRYYVRLLFDISTPVLDDEAGALTDTELLSAIEQGDTYLINALEPLSALGATDFTPNLATLDALIASLVVAPDASTTSSLPTNLPGCTNAAEFIADVTIPDGTTIERGEVFTKTWRLRNSGTCAWTPGYGIETVEGDNLNLLSEPTIGIVKSGSEHEISIVLKAPETPGYYKTWWQLRNDSGAPFGPRFYVAFEAPQRATTIAGYGVVEGKISYPAGGMPAMTIYFLRVDESERYFLETEEGWNRYRNEIPVGEYYVFARGWGDTSQFGGGYTQSVRCGLSAQCDDHSLVPVRIEEGKTARNIDITDWYAPAGAFPLPKVSE